MPSTARVSTAAEALLGVYMTENVCQNGAWEVKSWALLQTGEAAPASVACAVLLLHSRALQHHRSRPAAQPRQATHAKNVAIHAVRAFTPMATSTVRVRALCADLLLSPFKL
jgi:hypothetical protein